MFRFHSKLLLLYSFYFLITMMMAMSETIEAPETESLETAAAVAINYAAAANAYRLPQHYAGQYAYSYYEQKPVRHVEVEVVRYYIDGPNYPTFGLGYHGFFGRTYNYANFGYGGIFGGHGLPLYSGLIHLSLYES